jgi:hypothetical protein
MSSNNGNNDCSSLVSMVWNFAQLLRDQDAGHASMARPRSRQGPCSDRDWEEGP